MTTDRLTIPHYENARAMLAGEPGLTDESYRELAAVKQQRMADDIDSGNWDQSNFCEPFTRLLIDRLDGKQCFVDVGADIGYYGYLARRTLPAAARVICIEPDPVRAQLLREFFFRHPGVDVHEVAVTAEPGIIRCTKPQGCSATLAPVNGEVFTVPAVRLDDLLADQPVDLIKIDVEGAEALAFDGMTRVLAEHQPEIFLEYHPWIEQVSPGGIDRLTALLLDHGYRFFRTDRGGFDPVDRLGGRLFLAPPGINPVAADPD